MTGLDEAVFSTRAEHSSAVHKFAALALAAAFLLPPQAAAFAGRTKHRRVYKPVSIDVQPAPEIDAQVAAEVGRAKLVLESMQADNFLASPYLVSAIYYHDGFLADFPVDRDTASPERRIIGQIDAMVTPAIKARFVSLAHKAWDESNPTGPAPRPVIPVNYSLTGGGHPNAIDLFAPEGSAVRSVTRGVVILADGDWNPDFMFSTSSRKGGNSVIVFDPDHDRFLRYCHMDAVGVSAGQTISTGDVIGTVGHTGLNASQPGHGRHLHFEVNEYADGRVKAMDLRRLRAVLKAWRTGVEEPPPGKSLVTAARAHTVARQ